jgi:serine/threonine protein kinase
MEPASQSVENMCNLLIRSRLLQAPDVQLMHRRWRLEARDASNDVPKFTRWLVSNQYLTDFQAQSLARGHADHFFLGQYKLLDRIGKGRMAGVYKGLHNLGNIVAVKILPPSKVRDPQALARFQREAKMAVKLKHLNVVRAFHMGNASGVYFLVMEYLEGETLEDVLKRRHKLPVGEAVRIVHQTMVGLQHIHEQGLIHRDLKPANLMLVPAAGENTLGATVKILDIGLGRALFDENAPSDMDDMQLTTEGAVLGTPDYLAPEQARDAHKVDVRADIYSLGCLLYHVLTGQVPFPDKNALHQIVRHATETARPVRDLEPSVPEALQGIIQRMMSKTPDQRYATPGQAAAALLPFLPRETMKPAEAGPHQQAYLKWLEGESAKESAGEMNVAPAGAHVELVAAGAHGAAPPPPSGKRDFFLLAVGFWVGAAVVLIVEAILYFALRP